jgi:NADPH2:quinone reductase
MKAAFIEAPGPPETIRWADRPTPEPSPGQVRVTVGAVSVNPVDTYLRSGLVKMPIPLPFIVGCDAAGTVDAVGSGVSRLRVGDRVWCSNQGLLGRQGTFAERIVVDECWLYPSPSNVPDRVLAAAALTGITAHLGLFRHARVKPGDTLFVSGGTGGVGSMVIPMARAVGARVITTAGSAEKVERCRALGAEVAINYRTEDVAARVKEAAPAGIDIWWETVREPDFERAVPLLAPGARIIVMAGREAKPVFPIGPFYTRDCSLHGYVMFNAKPEHQSECAADLNRWLSTGLIEPLIGAELPMSEAAAAHRLQEENTLGKAGTLSGKIVLTP